MLIVPEFDIPLRIPEYAEDDVVSVSAVVVPSGAVVLFAVILEPAFFTQLESVKSEL